MIKLENQTVFKCSYCSRISRSAAGIRSHELYCKKNPHNVLLCPYCYHLERVEKLGEEYSKCGHCNYNNNCMDSCTDNRLFEVDFICKIDGSKMYSPKIRRKSSFEDIKKRCDRPMSDATQVCENFKSVVDPSNFLNYAEQ